MRFILKKYRNQLFEHLQGIQNAMTDFDVAFDTEFADCLLVYKPYNKKFQYRINQSGDHYDYFYSFGTTFTPGFKDKRFIDGLTSFTSNLEHFDIWRNSHLQMFIEEQNEIDLWESYQRGINPSDLSKIDFLNNDRFSELEISQIKLGINELRFLIPQKFALLADQTKLLNDRLDYLDTSLERLNKLDWKNIFISTIIGIATTLALDSNQGKELWDMFLKLIHFIPQISY